MCARSVVQPDVNAAPRRATQESLTHRIRQRVAAGVEVDDCHLPTSEREVVLHAVAVRGLAAPSRPEHELAERHPYCNARCSTVKETFVPEANAMRAIRRARAHGIAAAVHRPCHRLPRA